MKQTQPAVQPDAKVATPPPVATVEHYSELTRNLKSDPFVRVAYTALQAANDTLEAARAELATAVERRNALTAEISASKEEAERLGRESVEAMANVLKTDWVAAGERLRESALSAERRAESLSAARKVVEAAVHTADRAASAASREVEALRKQFWQMAEARALDLVFERIADDMKLVYAIALCADHGELLFKGDRSSAERRERIARDLLPEELLEDEADRIAVTVLVSELGGPLAGRVEAEPDAQPVIHRAAPEPSRGKVIALGASTQARS